MRFLLSLFLLLNGIQSLCAADFSRIPSELMESLASDLSSTPPFLTKNADALKEFAFSDAGKNSTSGRFYQSLLAIYGIGTAQNQALGNQILIELGKDGHTETAFIVGQSIRWLAITQTVDQARLTILTTGDSAISGAAHCGLAVAQHALAERYAGFDEWTLVPRNDEAAIEWYSKAATSGLRAAQARLIELAADHEFLGEMSDEQWSAAAKWAEAFSKEQRADADYFLGRYALRNAFLDEEYQEALTHFEKAAQKHHAPSIYEIGQIHFLGLVGEKDLSKALAQFERAAILDFPPALSFLGIWYYTGGYGTFKPDKNEALPYLSRAADYSDPDAEYYYGLLCLTHLKNRPKAKVYLGAASEKDHPDAQLHLAALLQQEVRTIEDYSRVIELYSSAHAAGLPRATYALGTIYLSGIVDGTPPSAGVALLRQAAIAGYAPAQTALGQCYAQGRGVDFASGAEAVLWFKRGIAGGHATAHDQLASCYRSGYGVLRDATEAEKLEKDRQELVRRYQANPLF